MALDPSIALGVKPVQIESPINQMAKMYEMQNAQQSNQLNQMKMDEYTRGVAEAEQFKNALAQSNDETAIRNAFYAKGDVKGYNDYLKSVAEQKKLDIEATNLGFTGQKTQVEAADKKQSMMQSMMRDLSTRPSDANIMAYAEDVEASPLFSPQEKAAVKRRTKVLLSLPIDQRVPELASQGASAGELKPTIQTQNLNDRSVVSSYPAFGGAPKQLSSTPMGVAPSSDIPKLKPGEKWDSTTQTVKQIPGSAEFNKQSKVHGTDYNAAKTVVSKMDNAIKKVDEILSPKNASGFENNFGGYNAAVSRMFTGNTATVRKNIDSLKADMKSAGLELVRSGGSIGALTEREWPMLEAQIDAIDYMLDEDAAKAAFDRVKSTFARIKDQAKDTYQTTWGETQYYKPEVLKDTSAAPAAPARKNVGSSAKPSSSWSVEK
jgi:hypothetical protein